MYILNRLQVFLLCAVCALLSWQSTSAQTYVRYVKPEDFGTRTLYADSVLTSIRLPHGTGLIASSPKLNAAVYELTRVLQDPDKELMQVWVCGSTSPDGLWGDNVELCEMRTEAAAAYIRDVTGIPESMIHKESLNEDWNRLAELVTASDLPYKYEVLYIIRSKTWGERKRALQALDGGKVWKILEKDFFPELRGIRFAIFCKWNPTKPYLSMPVEDESPATVMRDTVYVRDTVYIPQPVAVEPASELFMTEPEIVQEEVSPVQLYEQYRQKSISEKNEKKLWDTPWKMGLKTNILADVMAIGMGGVEFQIGKRVSLDISGWYTDYNMFCKEDKNTNVYGVTPEIRWWVNDRAMERGSFFGIHGRAAWYTLQWTDGYLYQNGMADDYNGNAGNNSPTWSVGLTYGYSFALDRKANWGVELLLGLGYGNYSQNRGLWSETDSKWLIYDSKNNTHIGITRAAINLTYRFSVRKVKPEYYTE